MREEKEIAAQPQFNEADYTSNHCFLSLCTGRHIYFDLVLEVVWVYPHKYLPFVIREYHILVNHKKTIDGCQLNTCIDNRPSISEGLLVGVEFFQLREGGLDERFSEDRDVYMVLLLDEETRSTRHMILMALLEEEQFFF